MTNSRTRCDAGGAGVTSQRPVPHPASITSAPAGTPSASSPRATSPTAPPAGSGTSMSYAHAHDP